jgi:TusA-related sulfurtransferase
MENNYRLNETSVPSILHEILQSASASRAERGEALWILTNLRCAKNYSPNYISDQVAIQLLEEDDEEMLDNVAWYLRTLALRSEGVDWLAGSTALLLKQKLLRVQSKKTLALLLSVVSAVLQRKVSEQTATYFIKPIFNSLCN